MIYLLFKYLSLDYNKFTLCLLYSYNVGITKEA